MAWTSLFVSLWLGSAALAAPNSLTASGHWEEPSFGQATLPPMGWNSWNAFLTKLDEEKVVGSAEAIVRTGLRDLGYRTINIDDGWWLRRRQPDGKLVVRTSIFPSAATDKEGETSFRPLVERLHRMGLKAGIYSDIGRNACSQGYPGPDSLLPEGTLEEREVGLYGHVRQDLDLYFGEWGFDYIKVDGCGLNAFDPSRPLVAQGRFRAFPALVDSENVNLTDIAKIRSLYREVRDTLTVIRPKADFILSLCNWGTANVRAWGREIGNLWRTSDDITPVWSHMLYNFDSVATRELYSGPGHWNDPDMLFIGHGDFDENHLVEARTHFALWAIEDAPLIIGYDLRGAPQTLLDIWGAPEVVAVNQDKAGNQGVMAYTSDDVEIIVKQLERRGEKAVLLFNRGLAPADGILTAEHVKMAPDKIVSVRDLWARQDLAGFTGQMRFHLEARQSLLFKVTGTPELADGIYLSEMPARLFVAADGVIAPEADPQIHRMSDTFELLTKGTGSRAALAGWGGPRADSTPYNQELRIGRKAYRSGIGALGNSRLQVKADGQYRRFSAEVGVDNSSSGHCARIRFEVYADGKLVARSPLLGFGEPAASITADIAGHRVIELIARQQGSDAAPVAVTWGEAALRF